MRLITYDIEIAREVDEFPDKWDAARRGECGVSSVALYDTETQRYHVYDASTIGECFDHLNEADLLIGFNNLAFDTPALEGFAKLTITPKQYDILAAVWSALGAKRFKGYGLGPICERTLGIGKTGSGESAPRLFKQGRYAELIDYNINDVHLTRTLYNYITENGHIIDVDGKKLSVSTPEEYFA